MGENKSRGLAAGACSCRGLVATRRKACDGDGGNAPLTGTASNLKALRQTSKSVISASVVGTDYHRWPCRSGSSISSHRSPDYRLCSHYMSPATLTLSLSMFPLRLLSALVALLLIAAVQAETDVMIDDMDPRIVYQPPGVWSIQSNVRPSRLSRTANTHFSCRRRPR